MEIYPNPANDFFVVYNYGNNIQRNIQVYDANGRLLKQTRAVSVATRIATSDLRGGVYIVRIVAADGSVISTQKVAVTK